MTTNKKENAGFYSMPAIRYAHVLSELGISGAAVEETEEILEQTKELKEILEHPVITKENKHDIIDRIFPEEMKNFLKVVVDNGKVDIVMEIFGAYEELRKKSKDRDSKITICNASVRRTEEKDGNIYM